MNQQTPPTMRVPFTVFKFINQTENAVAEELNLLLRIYLLASFIKKKEK